MISIAILLHVLAAVIWVGGMFFAYVALRPTAASILEPPQRLGLWVGVFGRFFPWVWISVALLPLTGYWAAMKMYGGFGQFPLYVNLMQGLGIIMILVYMHVYFAPFKRLKAEVSAGRFAEGAKQLNQIRQLIAVNLTLGLVVVAIAAGGRFGLLAG